MSELKEFRDTLIKELVNNLLWSEDDKVRESSLIALTESEQNDANIVFALLDILRTQRNCDKDTGLVMSALQSLNKLFNRLHSFKCFEDEDYHLSIIGPLLELLKDEPKICKEAAITLGSLIKRMSFIMPMNEQAQTLRQSDKEISEIIEIAKNGIRNSFY